VLVKITEGIAIYSNIR